MKYIRTKNGIYEIDEIRPYFLDEKQKLFMNNTMKIAVNENLVISQADTIEELCDEFVIDDKRNNTHYLMDYDDVIEEIYCGRIYEKDVIYGAIWTSKGCIYVAKMDSEGKLVLI